MKRILISLEIPDLQPWNRFSAVACVVCSFAEILAEDQHEIYINQYPLPQVIERLRASSDKDSSGKKKGSRMYKIFPKRVREFVKDIALFRKLNRDRELLKQNVRPDLIISWISYGSDNGFRLSKYWNVPLISIYDNPINEEYRYQHGFFSFFKSEIERREERMLKNSSGVIVYSDRMAEHLASKYPFTSKYYFKQFIDLQKINVLEPTGSDSAVALIFIGSFFNWHKIDVLISVFERLKEEYPFLRLYLVGDGPEKPRISALIGPGRKDIVLTGLMDREELNNLLQKCHIGIIPFALWFHAPVKLFQYAAAGLCVVSYDTPTIRYIAREDEGAFCFFKTEQELYHTLKNLVDRRDDIMVKALRAQGFYMKNYSRQIYRDFFSKIFADVGKTELRSTPSSKT